MGTSTEELNHDIARTRAELSQDVDALQYKVSPAAIIERRKSAARGRMASVKSKVMGTGSNVAGTGRCGIFCPLPIAAAATSNRVNKIRFMLV